MTQLWIENHETLVRNKILGSSATVLTLLGGGYWYVFIAGIPQIDPPQVTKKQLCDRNNWFPAFYQG